MERRYLYAYLRICRGIAVYVLYLAVTNIGQFLYLASTRRMGADGFTAIIDGLCCIFSFLVFGSVVRIFAENDSVTRNKCVLPNETECTLSTDIKRLFGIWEIRLEWWILLALPILLPIETGFFLPARTLFGNTETSRAVQKLALLAIYLPLFFLYDIWMHISAVRLCREDRKRNKETPRSSKLLKDAAFICFLYWVGYALLSLFVPVLISLPAVFALLAVVLVPIILLLFAFPTVRGLCIRHKFLRMFKRSCRNFGYTVSKIKHPYLSLLCPLIDTQFILSANGKRYTCKILGSLRRICPLYFHENGTVQHVYVVRFRRIEVASFSFKTLLCFEPCPDSSETQKILIINPVPAEIFAGNLSFSRPIDTGERVGDVRIFTATGFLNALKRDCIER